MNIIKILDERDTCIFLQNLLAANGGKIHLTSVGRGSRVILSAKNGKISYKQGTNGKDHNFDIKLFVDTITALNGSRVDRTVLENFNSKYKSRPCNVLLFMLLANLIYGIPIQGAGSKHNSFFM